MAVNRAGVVDENFQSFAAGLSAAPPRTDLEAPVRPGTELTAREAIRIFEAQVESRLSDIIARELKGEGHGYYTIGGSGHEGNAAVAAALRPDDPAFLHYRSGGFFAMRSRQVPGPEGVFDVFRGMVAAADEPIAGGRHKVYGSVALAIPPQTSTIASHLPKALGCAVAMDRIARKRGGHEQRIAVCTFGDASSNHSTATGALNAAGWAAVQNVPAPVLFVCEDNGIGISVRTPTDWVGLAAQGRAGVKAFTADGLDLVDAWETARAAAEFVRRTRKPAFLRLKVVRMLGHAGSDVEQLYRTKEEIEAVEAMDPLLRSAALLVDNGWMNAEQVVDLYESTRRRLRALADEATRRPKLETAEAVIEPLFFHDPEVIAAKLPRPSAEARAFARPPEDEDRPRHLAFQLNRGLSDVLAAVPESLIFGEDVGKKGGVYHVTAGLTKSFGVGRVFNTLLDEQTILGLAIGATHAGLLPIPEIQYLAYLMNAIDQLRGEAGSMQFFSNGQYNNGMVVRIAGLAYQKGFGGHFHNDNGIAALTEIPGLLIGCPSRGDEAVRMLRTMVSAARNLGRVCVLLEPIALYMTKDLHEEGDGEWLTLYPPLDEHLSTDEVGVYGDGEDLTIATYANGLWMSLRVAKRLEAMGHRVRVLDLRWLCPLPVDAVVPHAQATGKLLIVDECRANSGIADKLFAEVVERDHRVRVRRLAAHDTYIPLGAAANLVLIGEEDIERSALKLLGEEA
ncbi:MAG: MFS transporter [Deltaproteobacteria bacterium]|nr:MAG: MFS transporter [Deltaproteobacteria bacterium]